MIEFNNVRRRTRGAYSTLYRQPRQIAVSLEPGDLICFREVGRRQKFMLAADDAFRIAIRHEAARAARERIAARKLKRKTYA
jgi:hypothetical protein